MMRFKRSIRVLLSTSGMIPLPLGIALAQSTGGAPSGIEEVVVTAQRRAEPLQTVPITVDTIDASAAHSFGVRETTDLTMAVPGLQMAPQNLAVAPFIRGVGNRNSAIGDESAAAVYVDGVYIADMAGARFAMNNIDHIEVLKGPQGTLFGRNAAAGVIQLITKDPSETPSADLSLGYGNYDTKTLNFYGTTGITSKLAADAAVYAEKQSDGWGVNTATGDPIYRGSDISARTKWVLKPDDNTTVKVAYDYLTSIPVDMPAYRPLPGQVLLGGTPYPGFYNVSETVDVHGINHQEGGSADISHDFGSFSVVNIASYRRGKSYQLFDQDGTPANVVTANFNQSASTWTEELQILSPDTAKIKWIGGAFYMNAVDKYDPLALAGSALGALTEGVFATQTLQSYAAFGQGTVNIDDKSHLTAGLRYTADDRQIVGFTQTNLLGNINPANQSAEFSKPTWHAALDRQFDPDLFGYLQYSRGFKSGVYNAVTPTAPPVAPEVVDAAETGFKSYWLDHRLRLNGSIFYDWVKNIQLQVPSLGTTLLVNAAASRIYGGDLDLEALPIQNLKLTASASLLHGRYTSFPNGPIYTPRPGPPYGDVLSSGPLNGHDTAYSPPFTGTLEAEYTVPLAVGKLAFTGSFYHSSHYFFDAQSIARQPSYNLVNGTVGWESPNERVGLEVWAKNIGNTPYYANIIPQAFGLTGQPAPPRTYGVTARFRYN